jgi:hypothetical protein
MLGVLDEEHDRQVLQHRIEEIASVLELGGLPGQRLLGPAVFRNLPLELALGLPRGVFFSTGASACRFPAVEDAVDA